jgi:hypothetical protein
MLNRYRRKNDDLPYQSTDSENSNNVPEIEITTELHLAEEGIATENIGGQGKVEAWDYDASDEITLEPDYFEESLRILPNHLEKTNSLELEDGPARGPKYIRQVQSHGVEGIKVESAQDQVDATGKQNEITPASGQPGNLGIQNKVSAFSLTMDNKEIVKHRIKQQVVAAGHLNNEKGIQDQVVAEDANMESKGNKAVLGENEGIKEQVAAVHGQNEKSQNQETAFPGKNKRIQDEINDVSGQNKHTQNELAAVPDQTERIHDEMENVPGHNEEMYLQVIDNRANEVKNQPFKKATDQLEAIDLSQPETGKKTQQENIVLESAHHFILNKQNEKIGEIDIETLLRPHDISETAILSTENPESQLHPENKPPLQSEIKKGLEQQDDQSVLVRQQQDMNMSEGAEIPQVLVLQNVDGEARTRKQVHTGAVLEQNPNENEEKKAVVEMPKNHVVLRELRQPANKHIKEPIVPKTKVTANGKETLRGQSQFQKSGLEQNKKPVQQEVEQLKDDLVLIPGQAQMLSKGPGKGTNNTGEPVEAKSKELGLDEVKGERVLLPAGHGLQFGFTLGQLDKAEKMKMEIFSNNLPLGSGDF